MREIEVVESGDDVVAGAGSYFRPIPFIVKVLIAGIGDGGVEVFGDHVGDTAGGVSEGVCEVGVVDFLEFSIGEVGVGRTERALRYEVPAEGVEAELLDVLSDGVDFDEVAEGFTHFATFSDPE